MNGDLDSADLALAEEVKKSLFEFINKNLPSADVSAIDDIVLAYVVAIFNEVSDDSCFDVDGFIEMMGAYVPEFHNIDEGEVCSWVLEVEADLVRQHRALKDKKHRDLTESLDVRDMLPPPIVKSDRTSGNSESEEDMEQSVFDAEDYSHQIEVLREMFPNTCVMEIKHCITIADGEIDLAAATLLHRQDNGQALTGAVLPLPRQHVIDDVTLKYRIIERYSYIDKSANMKEHRPLAPKYEPKKMVRYRDSKVVSLKGEKYTDAGADEGNLKKPKKSCI